MSTVVKQVPISEIEVGDTVVVAAIGWIVESIDLGSKVFPGAMLGDAALIVAAVNALPGLLDRLEAAERVAVEAETYTTTLLWKPLGAAIEAHRALRGEQDIK